MTRPWTTLDSVPTTDGELKLLQRGEDDFMITIAGRVLMVSAGNRSEKALARLAADSIASRRRPRMLIGGLGLGYTLRAALDHLPQDADVLVAELTEQVVAWCHGPLAALTDDALGDPRVTVRVDDVMHVIGQTAARPDDRFDAIVLDLYEGPNEANRSINDPFYGPSALALTRAALNPGGLLAVWAEDPDPPYEKRLVSQGFDFKRQRPDGGGRRHVIYLATPRRESGPLGKRGGLRENGARKGPKGT